MPAPGAEPDTEAGVGVGAGTGAGVDAAVGDGVGADDSRIGQLLVGATVLDPRRRPAGTTLALLGDRILAVAGAEDCRRALESAGVPGDAIAVRDLSGSTVVPGFVDAHLHPMVMSVFEQQLLLDEVGSVADLLDLVAERALDLPVGDAIFGFQLDGELLAERRLPAAAELDAAAGGRPVVLLCRDGHHAVGSGTALRAAGLADPSSPPSGGSIESDASGRPTGLVGERAVEPLMALMPEVTIDGLVAGTAAWAERLLRHGVTSISAMCQTTAEGPAGPAGELEALGWSVLSAGLPFDVQTILITPEPGEVLDARDPALHDPARGRRLDAVKLFLDGTLGGRTACMHHPFTDAHSHTHAHGGADGCGIRTTADDEAFRRMEAAHLAGLQICIHAIGDAANHAAANLYERVLARHPGPHRHRVEHASVVDDRTVERYARLGITAVVQPINLRSERHWLARRVGPERLRSTYAFRSMVDAGVRVAGSSDAPIERTDVLAALAASVDRGGQADDQALTRAEALAMFTTGAAWARRTEDEVGALRPGLRADIVELDADPTDSATDLDAVQVRSTTVAGRIHHRHQP